MASQDLADAWQTVRDLGSEFNDAKSAVEEYLSLLEQCIDSGDQQPGSYIPVIFNKVESSQDRPWPKYQCFGRTVEVRHSFCKRSDGAYVSLVAKIDFVDVGDKEDRMVLTHTLTPRGETNLELGRGFDAKYAKTKDRLSSVLALVAHNLLPKV